MFKRSKVATGVLLALGGGFALGAFAQATDRVEITGSRIKALATDSPSPIISLTAEALKIAGSSNVEEILNNLPQVFAGYGAQVSNGSTGTATVDLRGLGPSRTLVLINGRRVPAGDPGYLPADLNQIPTPLLKRVEVLTGGASAVYGSDAVSGVVNFILDDRFEGVQFQVGRSIYNHSQKGKIDDALAARNYAKPGNIGGDGGVNDYSLTIGSNFGGDKGNATLFLGFRRQAALLQSQRDFSACSVGLTGSGTGSGFNCGGSSTSYPGRFTNATTGASYSYDAAGNVRSYSGARDAYNFGPLNYFQRPDDRYTAAAYGNYKISDMARVYTEFNFMDDHSVAQIAPSGLFFGNIYQLTGENPLITSAMQTALGITNGSATPVDVYIGRRNVEGGGRRDDLRHTMFRGVAGVKGDIGAFSYDASAQIGKVIYQEEYFNDFSVARAQRALDAVRDTNGNIVCRSVVDGTDPNCVPYNIFNPGGVQPNQIAYLSTPGLQRGYTSQLIYNLNGSVDLGVYGIKSPLASQGIGLAFGIENRQEKSELETDTAFSTGDLAGQGGPSIGVGGNYRVNDVFGELRAPLIEKKPGVESLILTTSYRHSSYSTDKTTSTYGVGLDWSVIKGYKLRGSIQKAVRAPNIIELYRAQSVALFNMNSDPCAGTAPTATQAACALTGVTAAQYGNVPDNSAGQYNQRLGGNTSLKAETSNSYTFGAVLQPVRDVNITLDYFSFKIKDQISTVSPNVSLTQCLTTGNPTFCGLIHRATGNGSLWTGNSFIEANNANVAGFKTAGLDVGIDTGFKLQGMGRIDISALGTLTQKYEAEPVLGTGTYDCVGYHGATCGTPTPKWRHRATMTWNSPYDLSVSTSWRYLSGVDDEGVSTNQSLNGSFSSPNSKLPSVSYFDLSVSYTFMKAFTLRAGVRNLFDKDPPLAVTGAPFGNGNTYPTVYDALGRQLSLNLTAKF